MYRSMWNRQPEAGVGCSICDPVILTDPTDYALRAETCESLSGARLRHVGCDLCLLLLAVACMGLLRPTVHSVCYVWVV